jgi:peptidoglycan LD-endopeptidase CwlK
LADTNLSDLHPDLQPLATQWLNECLQQGLHVKIIQTWRDPAYQDQLFAQGRTAAGPVVTDLNGSQSLHCFTIDGKPASRAFDFACFDSTGAYITDGTDNHYALAGQIGISMGLEWGGNWKGSLVDYDHLQLIDSTSNAV